LGSNELVVNADKFNLAPVLQVAALLVGLSWSVALAGKLAKAGSGALLTWRKAAPLAAFSLLYTLLMLGLLVG